jgi:NADPH:quinone reductase-like Zn-dependent oxidoreductase
MSLHVIGGTGPVGSAAVKLLAERGETELGPSRHMIGTKPQLLSALCVGTPATVLV